MHSIELTKMKHYDTKKTVTVLIVTASILFDCRRKNRTENCKVEELYRQGMTLLHPDSRLVQPFAGTEDTLAGRAQLEIVPESNSGP